MALAGAHLVSKPGDDPAPALRVVEKGDVLFPGEADHHPEAVLEGGVEQPRGRRHVGA